MGGYREHWFFGFIISGVTLGIMNYVFHINILDESILAWSVIATLLFSILPDVDHQSSYISAILHITAIAAIFAIFSKIIPFNISSILILISIGGLEIYHWKHATNSWDHRQLPHTFTFGVLASLIFFAISKHWVTLIIAILTFFSHILLDNYLEEAIKKDKDSWDTIFSMIG